jgi:filamentous hemagglutinin family protein
MKQVARLSIMAGGFAASWFSNNSSLAQVSSDGTLPTDVTQSGNVFNIDGGAQAGDNLFHSFEEFSLPSDFTASFNNDASIANIISRVTGGSASNIDGLIKANGNANLILINPNGIIFGANAQLNIGGSFLGTTANSIKFADGTEFSATKTQDTPLLTVSIPIGLQFGQNSAAIEVRDTGHNVTLASRILTPFIDNTTDGLRLQSGKTLALIGNNVALDGGKLNVFGGRIELGSVSEGTVDISPVANGWTFGYDKAVSFQDIQLSQKSLLNASGIDRGSIHLQGRNISFREGSIALLQNLGNDTLGEIRVNASQSLELKGTAQDALIPSGFFTEALGSANGTGGEIEISTQRLLIQDGALILTNSYTPATGGYITVNATESIHLIGFSEIDPSRLSSISSLALANGNAGDITISTERLQLDRGASMVTGTFGSGSGGNLLVNASKSVALTGIEPTNFSPSILSAGTGGSGNAGSVTINTQRLAIADGGRVDASTLATGKAGSVTINASESIDVSGTVKGSLNPSLIISSANLVDSSLQDLFGLPNVPSGESGDLSIKTNRLNVSNGAQVTVRNDGVGNAGNLKIIADSILLSDKGALTAATKGGNGGNIDLKLETSLLLRDRANISAIATGRGRGGNINIDTQTVTLLDSSQITADAVRGRGGNIAIDSKGLFVCADCRITASSNLGIDGRIEIRPDLTNLVEVSALPAEPIATDEVVALACAGDRRLRDSTFTIAGRGGLPPQPTAPQESEALVNFDAYTNTNNLSSSTRETKPKKIMRLPPPIQGWYVNSKGRVVLTDRAINPVANNSNFSSLNCSEIQSKKGSRE